MKKKLLVITALFTCLVSYAAEWIEVCPKNYIMIENLAYPKVSYWAKSLNDGNIQNINNKKVSHEMLHIVSNCSNNTQAILSTYSYDLKGNVLNSIEMPYYNYQIVVPQSFGESFQNYVCSYFRGNT